MCGGQAGDSLCVCTSRSNWEYYVPFSFVFPTLDGVLKEQEEQGQGRFQLLHSLLCDLRQVNLCL